MRKVFLILFLLSMVLVARDYPTMEDTTHILYPNIFLYIDTVITATSDSTDWKISQVGASVDRDGKPEWFNPGNITDCENDDLYTRSVPGYNDYSDWLRATQFGFTTSDIPAGGGTRIDGIKLKMKVRSTGVQKHKDDAIYLHKTSGQVGDNKATTEWWDLAWEYMDKGGKTDDWNANLTQSDICSDDFGVDISIRREATGSVECRISCIQIKIFYTVTDTLVCNTYIGHDGLKSFYVWGDLIGATYIQGDSVHADKYLNIPFLNLIDENIKIVTTNTELVDTIRIFNTLKEAVDSSEVGDIIIIQSGHYPEKNSDYSLFITTDSLTILGEEGVYFDSLERIPLGDLNKFTIKNINAENCKLENHTYMSTDVYYTVHDLYVSNVNMKTLWFNGISDTVSGKVENSHFEHPWATFGVTDGFLFGDLLYSKLTFDNCTFIGRNGMSYAVRKGENVFKNCKFVTNSPEWADGTPYRDWAVSLSGSYTTSVILFDNCEIIGPDSAGAVISWARSGQFYFQDCVIRRELTSPNSPANIVIDGYGNLYFDNCLIFYGDWNEFWYGHKRGDIRGYGALSHSGNWYFNNCQVYAGWGGINASTYNNIRGKIVFNNGYIESHLYAGVVGVADSPSKIDTLIINNSVLNTHYAVNVMKGSYFEMNNSSVKFVPKTSQSAITLEKGNEDYDKRSIVRVKNCVFEIPDSVSYFWGDTIPEYSAEPSFNSLDSNIYALRIHPKQDTTGFPVDSIIQHIEWQNNVVTTIGFNNTVALASNLEPYTIGFMQHYEDSTEFKGKITAKEINAGYLRSIPQLAAPGSPVIGTMYYDSVGTKDTIWVYDGSAWTAMWIQP